MTATYNDVQNVRQQKKDAEDILNTQVDQLKMVEAMIAAIKSNGSNPDSMLLNQQIQLQQDIQNSQINLNSAKSNLGTVLNDYMPPTYTEPGGMTVLDRETIYNINSSYPIIMMPLKIETRFINWRFDEKSGYDYGYESPHLWIRLYPDEIWAQKHEEKVTVAEYKKAAVFIANASREQWEELCRDMDPARAAWAVKKTQLMMDDPSWDHNPDNTANMALFSITDSKQPDAYLLPERFRIHLLARNFGTTDEYSMVTYYDLGLPGTYWNSKREGLKVGLDHNYEKINGQPPITRDIYSPEQDVVIHDEELKWIYDFEKAIDQGMAGRIKMDNLSYPLYNLQDPPSYEYKIIAVGVRESMDIEDSTTAIKKLFENHRFTEGMALLKQGSYTKNADNTYAGYATYELDNDIIYKAEFKQSEGIPGISLPLYEPESNEMLKPDGQILGEALGLGADFFDHIYNANQHDINNATRMNNVLWQAGGESIMRDMRGILSQSIVNKSRAYVKKYAMSRGRLPGFRIGNIPYGVIPACDTSGLNYAEIFEDGEAAARLKSEIANYEPAYWEIARSLGKAGSGEPKSVFAQILGKHAVPQELYERTAVGPGYVWNSFMLNGQTAEAINWINNKKAEAMSYMAELNLSNPIPPVLQLSFMDAHQLMDKPIVYDDTLLDTLPEIPGTGLNYIQWIQNARINELRDQDYTAFGGSPEQAPPNALLYELMRHSMLLEYWNVAADVLGYSPEERKRAEIINIHHEGNTESDFTNMEGFEDFRSVQGESKWAIFEKPVPMPDGSILSVASYIHQGYANDLESMQLLNQVKDDLNGISDLPPKDLELLTLEFIALFSYRFDSWQLSIVEWHLKKVRSNPATQSKSYIGAYGWVTGLAPRTALQENANKGYILSPSLTHAGTGALIKSAYNANNNPTDDTAVHRVTLTSERSAKALYYIQGINNGQQLGVLIGYEFERALHDVTSPIMDKFILPFRNAFPHPYSTDADPNGTVESMAPRNVVNGKTLLEAYRDETNGSNYNFFINKIQNWITPNSTERTIILNIMAQVSANIDGLSDLSESEAAFQMISGNLERAGAFADAISGSRNTPEPQILDTPVTGTTITNRATLHFNAQATPSSWALGGSEYISIRAITEPAVDEWLKTLLPSAQAIMFRIVSNVATIPLSVNELSLSPCDLLGMLDYQSLEENQDLKNRILYYFFSRYRFPPSTEVTIDYAFSTSGYSSLSEVFFILKKAASLLNNSRSLKKSDYFTPVGVKEVPEDVDEFNRTELVNRVTALKNAISPGSPIRNKLDSIIYFDFASVSSIQYVVDYSGSGANTGEFGADGSGPDDEDPLWSMVDAKDVDGVDIRAFCLHFTEGTQYVRTPVDEIANPGFPVNDFTVESWIAANSDWSAEISTIFSIADPSNRQLDFILGLNAEGRLICELCGVLYVSESINLRDDAPHHVAVVKEGEMIRFFVDAVFINEYSLEIPPSEPAFGDGNAYIGRSSIDAGDTFHGKIWELRVWNMVRSETEISECRYNGKELEGHPELLGYWHCNDLRDSPEILEQAEYIREISNVGLSELITDRIPDGDVERLYYIKEKATFALKKMNERIAACVLPVATDPHNKVLEQATTCARLILGSTFVLLPRFTFRSTSVYKEQNQIASMVVDQYKLLGMASGSSAFAMQLKTSEWIHGLARVRSKINDLELLDNLVYGFKKNNLFGITALQFPYLQQGGPNAADDLWVSMDFSSTASQAQLEKMFSSDRVSIGAHLSGGSLSASQCGILVDEWVEVVPNKDIVGGVSYHYDKPLAKAPQAIILAVPPYSPTPIYWRRDQLRDLLLSTFNLAMMRAVDYEDIAPTKLAQIAPGVALPYLPNNNYNKAL